MNKNISRDVMVFNKWLRGGDKVFGTEEWQNIQNTMSEGTNSQGGYAVPTAVAQEIADALKQYGGLFAVASIIQTTGGNPLTIPNSDGTSEVGELIGENTTATALDPSFGSRSLPLYKFSSKIITVPFELLQDSAVDMTAFINQRLVDRVGRIQNTKFTVGTGSGEPQGVVTAAASGVVGTTGQTTSVIYDNLADLIFSVDAAYRPKSRFMMNDATLKYIQKLKDSQNRPVFLPGVAGLGNAMASTILGYPVVVNNDMATMAANAKSILFGDFSRYMIRLGLNIAMFRMVDSAYAQLGQVAFLLWMRAGGVFTDVGKSLFYYQNSAT